MIELGSFNEIFSEAARRKLLLNSFSQIDVNRWRANWRTAHGLKPQVFYECVERDKPFTAIRDALLVAAGDPRPIEDRGDSPAGETLESFFG